MTALKNTKPTIGELIDRIGLGPTHLRFIFTGGGVWFADGVELSLISSITAAVAQTFEVGPVARGMLVTIVYFGVFFGNLMSGPFGDRYGRRFCLLVSYMLIFLFSVASSFSPTYATLAVIRFFVGVSFGFGQPVWNAMATEISPTKWRILINAGSQSLFTVGEVYCFFIVYLENPWMKHLDWRALLRQGAIPAIVFFAVAFLLLHDSPYYLSFFGRKREAQEVLESMQRENYGPELEDVDFQTEAQGTKKEDPDDYQAYSLDELRSKYEDIYDEQQLIAYWQHTCRQQDGGDEVDLGLGYGAIFSKELFMTTIIVTYTCFVMNFTYYGTLYAFPNVLPGLSHIGVSLTPAMELIVGALWGIPGYVLAVILCMRYDRKPVVKMYCLACGIASLLFAVGVSTGSSLVWHVGFYGIKAFIDVGYVVVYVYLGEVYPTKVRVTGGSVSIAGGRVGSMFAPLAFELLTSWTGAFFPFFVVISILCLINMPLIDLLPEGASTSLSSTCDGKESYGSMQALPH